MVTEADVGDVPDPDHRAVPDQHGHVQHVVDVFDHARNRDRDAAGAGGEGAGGDQPVVALHRTGHVFVSEAVGLDRHGIDDDLDEVVARADDVDLEHARQGLEPIP